MSWTDSCVVKAPRAGPISLAHCSKTSLAGLMLSTSNAGQLSGSDLPVPRWSKTMKSREPSAGAIASAMNSASGSAAWPGPPASATTALGLGLVPASRRSTLSEIVPGTAPARSSGTGTDVHSKVVVSGQGMKLRLEAAEELGQQASSAAGSRAVRARVRARRIVADNSRTRDRARR